MIALVELPRNELNPPRGGISATVFDVRRGYSSSLGTHRGPPPLASPIVIVGSGRPFARARVPLGDSFDGDDVQVRYALAQPLWPPAAIGTGGATIAFANTDRRRSLAGSPTLPQSRNRGSLTNALGWDGSAASDRSGHFVQGLRAAERGAIPDDEIPIPGVRGRGGRRRSPLCALPSATCTGLRSRSRPAAELAAHIGCGEPVSRGRCVARQGGMRLRVVPAVYSANGAARIRIGKAAWVVSQRALPAGIAAASAAPQARR